MVSTVVLSLNVEDSSTFDTVVSAYNSPGYRPASASVPLEDFPDCGKEIATLKKCPTRKAFDVS